MTPPSLLNQCGYSENYKETSMDLIQVELKKTKFFAYFFDGKEESAKQFCRKWSLAYQTDFLNKELVQIQLPNGKKLYGGNYVVIDGTNFSSYTKEQFLNTFDVVTNHRQSNYSFMSED